MTSNSTLITQELIIILIREEMKSNKLIFGLADLMVLAEPYNCDLTRTILTLMGFTEEERNEDLYNLYDEWMKSYITLETIEFHEQLDKLALSFYKKLIQLKSHDSKQG